MTNPQNQTYRIEDLAKATAYDNAGDKLGSVKDVYLNDATGQPDFVDVNHGLFNMNNSIVPLRGHSLRDGELHLAFSKDRIEDAPELGEDGHLTNEDQDAFYRHYGLENVDNNTRYDIATGGRHAAETDAAAGRHAAPAGAAAPAGDDATMIRSEERLNVDKQREESGRVSLRKYVEYDTETVEVPVEREEVRVERQPISEEEAANLRGRTELGEDEASVTLHEERVNVSKESVPVEKVSLDKDVVRDTETVTEDVAKERIETDGIDGTTDRR